MPSPRCQERENESRKTGEGREREGGGSGVMVEKGRGEEGRERGGREVKVCWREGK